MVSLKFTLTPEGCGKIYDSLSCLAKFSDSVTVEALSSQLALTALNSSKSAYVCFTLDTSFFANYTFSALDTPRRDRFSCQILNKALSSIFKGRLVDPRQRDSALERCEVSLTDGEGQAKCRLNIKMVCRHGVTKTYHLTYESIETMRALFDKNRATNNWKINAKNLREYVEYFAPKTEQLDIYGEEGKCTFLAFTEKISHGKEVLKQPLQTAVSIDTADFMEFQAVENLHVVINVKDFKNMVVHAESLKTSVTAMYSQPSKPLQFSYSAEGMHCEFTLMTIGEAQAADTTTMVSRATTRAASNRQMSESSGPGIVRHSSEMPPPLAPASKTPAQQPRLGRRIPANGNPPVQSQESQSLFMPEDDDRQWEPVDERDEEDQDVLGWDASGDHDVPLRVSNRGQGSAAAQYRDEGAFDDSGIAPTQRASQIRGLFD